MAIFTLASKVKLFYQLDGNPDKPLLILIHGYGSNHTTFDKLAPHLLDDFFIFRWDHRGHGQSDKPKGNSYDETLDMYTISQLALDLHEMVVGLHLIQRKQIFYYGHSMGGMILLQFMTYFPNICTRVAIGSSSAGEDTGSMKEQVEKIKSGEIILDEDYFRNNAKDGYTRKYTKAHPEIISEEVRRKIGIGAEILTAIMENIAYRYNLYQEVEKIDIPVLLIHGKRDKTLHHIFSLKLHKILPNSVLNTIPKMGHGINYEIPNKIAQQLIDFFFGNQ